MKTTLILLSLAAIAVLLIDILRLHHTEFTKLEIFYLVAQFFFLFIIWKSAAQLGFNSRQYAQAFYGSMAIVSSLAIALSVGFASTIHQRQARFALIEITAAYVLIVCGNIGLALLHRNMLNRFSSAHVLCAGILIFCGALSLASMAAPAGIVDDILRGFLGSLWLAQGIYGLAEPMAYLRGRADIVAHMRITPLVIYAVVLCSLAIVLRSQQREASRSSLAPDTQAEAQGASIHG